MSLPATTFRVITYNADIYTPKSDTLRRNPLKNFNIPTLAPPQTLNQASSSSIPPSDPYAYMTIQQPVGRRPEKLRFDLSLLFRDRKEYCIEEARAGSLGLLGKRWGPPPASEPGPHQVRRPVDFNDEGKKGSTRNLTGGLIPNMNMTMALSGEPTVTINTKEALKDVFGMYNSPEKSVKFSSAPGSKHAPLKKVELMKPPVARPTPVRNLNDGYKDENSQAPTKTPSPYFHNFVVNFGALNDRCSVFPPFCR